MADPAGYQVSLCGPPVDVGAQLAREAAVLAGFTSQERAPLALLWQGGPALVISQADRNLPRSAQAACAAAAEGWPVFVRATGGTAVALTPGVVNLALFRTAPDPAPTLASGFDSICRPIIAALARFGVPAGTGSAPGAFCDGRFNVLVGPRKIAGTAQRRTRQGTAHVLLAHAAVLVDAPLDALTGVVTRFYERAGTARTFTADALTSLAACLPAARESDLPARFVTALSEVLASGEY